MSFLYLEWVKRLYQNKFRKSEIDKHTWPKSLPSRGNSCSNVKPASKYHECLVVITLPQWPLNAAGFAISGVGRRRCSGRRSREHTASLWDLPPQPLRKEPWRYLLILVLGSPAAALLFVPTTKLPVVAAAGEGSAPGSKTDTDLTHHSPCALIQSTVSLPDPSPSGLCQVAQSLLSEMNHSCICLADCSVLWADLGKL